MIKAYTQSNILLLTDIMFTKGKISTYTNMIYIYLQERNEDGYLLLHSFILTIIRIQGHLPTSKDGKCPLILGRRRRERGGNDGSHFIFQRSSLFARPFNLQKSLRVQYFLDINHCETSLTVHDILFPIIVGLLDYIVNERQFFLSTIH